MQQIIKKYNYNFENVHTKINIKLNTELVKQF